MQLNNESVDALQEDLFVGFGEAEITPPLGTLKIGANCRQPPTRILDPLHVRAAVFAGGETKVGLVQLDTLSVRWTQVQDIRNRISSRYGFPGNRIMVFATHNHAGPAATTAGPVPRNEAYIEYMVSQAEKAFGDALSSMERCRIGVGFGQVVGIAFNRRIVMADGTVQTNATLDAPGAMSVEGPADPSLIVLAAQRGDGSMKGILVSFACHAIHHGREQLFSAGYPGALATEMAEFGVPHTLFLNGACGNISGRNPATGRCTTMEEVAQTLAGEVRMLLHQLAGQDNAGLHAVSTTLSLEYRRVTEEETRGAVKGAQRLGEEWWYDQTIPDLLERIEARKKQPVEVQVIWLAGVAIVGIPGELFSEHGIRIKESCWPRPVVVVGHANGMIGYLPTIEAFQRGGYETTFAPWSRMEPEAGDRIAEAVIDLIRNQNDRVPPFREPAATVIAQEPPGVLYQA